MFYRVSDPEGRDVATSQIAILRKLTGLADGVRLASICGSRQDIRFARAGDDFATYAARSNMSFFREAAMPS